MTTFRLFRIAWTTLGLADRTDRCIPMNLLLTRLARLNEDRRGSWTQGWLLSRRTFIGGGCCRKFDRSRVLAIPVPIIFGIVNVDVCCGWLANEDIELLVGLLFIDWGNERPSGNGSCAVSKPMLGCWALRLVSRSWSVGCWEINLDAEFLSSRGEARHEGQLTASWRSEFHRRHCPVTSRDWGRRAVCWSVLSSAGSLSEDVYCLATHVCVLLLLVWWSFPSRKINEKYPQTSLDPTILISAWIKRNSSICDMRSWTSMSSSLRKSRRTWFSRVTRSLVWCRCSCRRWYWVCFSLGKATRYIDGD